MAHLAFFRQEFVDRRRWLDDGRYTDLVALCQFLPGPTSSQVGMGLGLRRAGLGGAIAAWLGFTLPSAAIMIALAWGLESWAGNTPDGLLQGLKIAAVAVVVQAVWGMGRSLCPDRGRLTLAGLTAILALAIPSAWGQLGGIMLGALAGVLLFPAEPASVPQPASLSQGWRASLVAGGLFLVLLLAPGLTGQGGQIWQLFDAFYRTGSLVFGGGHVVLPLLQSEVVASGWVDAPTFLAGYGAAQAVPGPLFSLAGFLGAAAFVGRAARQAVCCACWRSSCRACCWWSRPCPIGTD